MLVLGIETSCDETSAAVVENGRKVLSNVVLSSLRLHKPYGGVVPEIACRRHAELIDTVISQAVRRAGCGIRHIGLVAVTNGPGLIGALLVGISAAKGLSVSKNIPLVGTNHIWAHLYSSVMDSPQIRFPLIGLAVSGGHTSLVYVAGFDRYRHLGRTTDDAAGEAFDKAAKVLGLGYPGGPIIERLAARGRADLVKFPKSLLDPGSLDFSFSGIKTAVLYYVHKPHPGGAESNRISNRTSGVRLEVADICASFQDSVVDVIVEKSIRACRKEALNTLVAGGGVIMNSRLRERLSAECKKFKIDVYFPRPEFCTDNAAMIAGLGYQLYRKGRRDGLGLEAFANIRGG